MEGRTDYKFIDRYHAARRTDILKAHPEVRSFMKIDPSFKYVALLVSLTQIGIAYMLQDSPIGKVVLFSLLVGTVFDCAIANSIHEIVHDQAFLASAMANKVFGVLINFSLAWPAVGGYYRSHRNHHAYLGTNLDAKYPSLEEAAEYDQTLWGRIKFILGHPLSFGARWSLNVKEPETDFAYWCFRAVFAFDFVVLYLWGYKSLLYLLLSFWVNDSFFIQGSKNFVDHWMDEEQNAYTSSYYGAINAIDFNIGYHREHHDLPNIPGRYQPQVTMIAHEYYEDERFIATNLFSAIWKLLVAPPGKGLSKHANKLVT